MVLKGSFLKEIFCTLQIKKRNHDSLCYITTSQLQVATVRKEWDVKK